MKATLDKLAGSLDALGPAVAPLGLELGVLAARLEGLAFAAELARSLAEAG
jgi:hypothetical protein